MSQRVVITDVPDAPVRRWEAPEVEDPGRPRPPVTRASPLPETVEEPPEPAPAPPTLEQIEEIQREARDEGFRQGVEEGRRSGEAETRAEAGRLRAVLDSLSPFVDGLDRRLEEELVALALAVARQLVRRELRIDPGQVVAVVRDALAVLPSSDRRMRLHLHPDDARIVRDVLHLSELDQPWRVIDDPGLSRGGVRLETDVSRVDATVEARLNAVIAAVWGGERRSDDETAEEPGDTAVGFGGDGEDAVRAG